MKTIKWIKVQCATDCCWLRQFNAHTKCDKDSTQTWNWDEALLLTRSQRTPFSGFACCRFSWTSCRLQMMSDGLTCDCQVLVFRVLQRGQQWNSETYLVDVESASGEQFAERHEDESLEAAHLVGSDFFDFVFI